MKTHPECPKVEPDLTSYLTGDLPAARAAAVRDHLTLCGSCRASAQELAITLDLLRGALAASPSGPECLDPARRAAVLAVRPSRVTLLLDAWLVPLARAAIFILVPALILAALMLPALHSGRTIVGKLSKAPVGADEMNAESLADSAYTVNRTVDRLAKPDAPAPMRRRMAAAAPPAPQATAPSGEAGALHFAGKAKLEKAKAGGAGAESGYFGAVPKPVESQAAANRGNKVSGPGSAAASAPGEGISMGGLLSGRTSRQRSASEMAPEVRGGEIFSKHNGLSAAPELPGIQSEPRAARTESRLKKAEDLDGKDRSALAASRPEQASLARTDPGAATDGAAATDLLAGTPLRKEEAQRDGAGNGRVLLERAFPMTVMGLVGGKNNEVTDKKAGLESLLDRRLSPETSILHNKASGVTGLKYRIEGERVIVSPASAMNEPLVVKAAKCNPADWIEKERPSDEETRKFLGDMGVPFPAGARLHHDAGTSLLTVTNTGENHELTVRIIEAMESDAQWRRQQPATRPAGFNPVVETAENAFSTFSIDVDTASYTMARRAILDGKRPAPESVRTEEFVNAFDYDYAPPAKGAFAIHVDGAPSPFRTSMDVLRIGVKGRRIGRDRHVPSNLTLVIDTSGSMQTDDRIGLIRRSLRMLVDQLDPGDRVAVVQFGSKAALRLEPTPAAQKEEILKVIDSLETSGSTQLEGGLKLGYEVAAKAFRSGASNRVILMSDGVANLGATEAAGILVTVEAHRKQGVRLTVLGFGTGAYDDAMLENLADKGDGAYTFIDSEDEAKRVLVDNLAATLHTIASDVKIQVEFNPRSVRRWRQLGYENRALTREQFRDDTVDAGEVGSGQSVTALYDLQIEGNPSEWIGMVRVRYRDLETGRIEEIERRLTSRDFTRDFDAASPRFRLAVGVAEFAELLRLSPHTFSGGRELADATDVLRPVAMDLSIDPQVQELVRLARAAQSLPY